MAELDRPRLALYLVLGIAVCLLGARYLRAQAPDAPPAGAVAATAAAPAGAGGVGVHRAAGGRVTVHVAGAVRRPGVYRLAPGARVDDALRRAGGAGRRADLTAVNLAAKLEDGRQVLVPERVPAAPALAGASGSGAPPRAAASGSGAPPGTAAAAPAAPINLNTATLEQLDTLDGVGPGIAQRIIDHRERHGGFERVEQLGDVPGIGPKRLAALIDRVTA